MPPWKSGVVVYAAGAGLQQAAFVQTRCFCQIGCCDPKVTESESYNGPHASDAPHFRLPRGSARVKDYAASIALHIVMKLGSVRFWLFGTIKIEVVVIDLLEENFAVPRDLSCSGRGWA